VELGIPIQIHASWEAHGGNITFPLAAYLIAAGNYTYFASSLGWSADSFPWQKEYSYHLGAPVGKAQRMQQFKDLLQYGHFKNQSKPRQSICYLSQVDVYPNTGYT